MTTFTETSLPALVFTLPAGHPIGSASALGNLTVTDAQGVSQAWLVWGMETDERYDITAASATLFYEAEGRTLLNSSAVVTLAGSSGGGTNNAVESVALPPFDVPVLSTQATGGGAHLTHVGSFRVFARVMNTAAATGTVTFRLDWAVGDFLTYTSNPSTTLDSTVAGAFTLVDLGYVTVPDPAVGASQRWEGRVIAQASANDKLRVDCLFLVPVDYASGEEAASTQAPSASAPVAYDSFDQTAGALAGKVTTIGSLTWAFLQGDTDDFQVNATDHVLTRGPFAGNDTAARLMSAGATSYTNALTQVDFLYDSDVSLSWIGIVFRYVDANNYAAAVLETIAPASGSDILRVGKRVASVGGGFTGGNIASPVTPTSPATWYTLAVSVTSTGLLQVWLYPRGSAAGSPAYSGTSADFATGGALASGKFGIGHFDQGTNMISRFDNFALSTPAASIADAAIFASRSLIVGSDSVQRYDSSGAFLQDVASHEGDYLRIPPTGREGRKVRFIAKASRNTPGAGPDGGIDDISAVLSYTPRYLSVPQAT